MITQIDISNFRSIKQQSIPLKKLNILYGANGSGKSSVAYAPYVMRNFFVNPNQRLNSLFNLGFINLGGFDEIISKLNNQNNLSIRVNFSVENQRYNKDFLMLSENKSISFELQIGPKNSKIIYKQGKKEYSKDIELPSTLLQKSFINTALFKSVSWDGFNFEKLETFDENKLAIVLSASDSTISFLNGLTTFIKNIEIISVRRGFFNPIFSTEFAEDSESHFALQIRNEGVDFESKIDYYFKQLFNKTFRFVANPGSSYFYLKTQNSKGVTTDLVNEGFGVNQTVYMLAKLLKKNTSLAFIEEPEIHLHPSAQAKLVDCFIDIVQKEDKQIFLSTHSENIVSTTLAKIANGELNKDDVQFYLAKFEDGETKIIPQEVNDKGQIAGGLMSFMETELSNLKAMLGI